VTWDGCTWRKIQRTTSGSIELVGDDWRSTMPNLRVPKLDWLEFLAGEPSFDYGHHFGSYSLPSESSAIVVIPRDTGPPVGTSLRQGTEVDLSALEAVSEGTLSEFTSAACVVAIWPEHFSGHLQPIGKSASKKLPKTGHASFQRRMLFFTSSAIAALVADSLIFHLAGLAPYAIAEFPNQHLVLPIILTLLVFSSAALSICAGFIDRIRLK
jgi:hypothetical protein